MSFRMDKVKREMQEFYDEIVTINGPRYRQPREWVHLYVDFFVALFDMNYTLGHLVAIGLPLWLIWG